VRTQTFTLDVGFRDADHWYAFSWSHGQRGMWERVPESERPGLRARMVASVGPEADGSLALSQDVRLTLGTRPT
jgi:hypothetical protein